MTLLANLSIRTILGWLIGTMGLLLFILSASALVDSIDRSADARRVAASTVTSQHLFKSLLAMRVERGGGIGSLLREGQVDSGIEADMGRNRRTSEEGYADGVKSLAEINLPELAPAIDRLKAAHDAVVAARAKVDAAIHQTKSARDPG